MEMVIADPWDIEDAIFSAANFLSKYRGGGWAVKGSDLCL